MTDNYDSGTPYDSEDLITPEHPTHYVNIAEVDRMAKNSWWFAVILAICLMSWKKFPTASLSNTKTVSFSDSH